MVELCHGCQTAFDSEHTKIRTESNQVFHVICSPNYTVEPSNLVTIIIMMHTLKVHQVSLVCAFLKNCKPNSSQIISNIPDIPDIPIPYLNLTSKTSIKREYKKWKTLYYELTGKHFYKIRSTSYF
jgi:hypothetical protein